MQTSFEKYCDFPGCSGGCSYCWSVKKTKADLPYYEAAQRVRRSLTEKTKTEVSDLLLLVEYVSIAAAPTVQPNEMPRKRRSA